MPNIHKLDANGITIKQEQFCLKFVECGIASEAYRHAYNTKSDTKPKTIWNDAYMLLCRPEVAARVKQIQEMALNVTIITVNTLTEKLEETYKLAKQEKQTAAMTGAIQAQAKLHGLGLERTHNKSEQTVNVTVTSFKKNKDDDK